jgi:hypothetical protein
VEDLHYFTIPINMNVHTHILWYIICIPVVVGNEGGANYYCFIVPVVTRSRHTTSLRARKEHRMNDPLSQIVRPKVSMDIINYLNANPTGSSPPRPHFVSPSESRHASLCQCSAQPKKIKIKNQNVIPYPLVT